MKYYMERFSTILEKKMFEGSAKKLGKNYYEIDKKNMNNSDVKLIKDFTKQVDLWLISISSH